MRDRAGSPPQEAGIAANWSGRDFPALAAQVGVPVRFSAAEHERVWEPTPAALAEIAALFAAAPGFRSIEQPDSGHNLSLGRDRGATITRVFCRLSSECIAAAVAC